MSPFIVSILSLVIAKPLLGFNQDGNFYDNDTVTMILCVIFIVLILFAFSICAGLYILTFVSDRETKLRYLYNFVGLKPSAYIVGNFIFDVVPFMISTGIFISMIYIMNLTYLYKSWKIILGVMATFGLEIITLTYLVSFIFKNSVYAFNKIGMWYVIFGLILPMVLTLLVALALLFASIESFYTW